MWRKRNRKILVIDEAKYCKKAIRKRFAKYGIYPDYLEPYQIDENIKRLKPDAILFDMELLLRNGMEQIRKCKSYSSAPVIVMGHSEEGALEALLAGAEDCIIKPDTSSPEKIEIFISHVASRINSLNVKEGLFTILR